MGAKLRTQGGCAPARAIACLTSASGDRETVPEGIVVAGVRSGMPVCSRERSGVAVECVALTLKRAVQ